MYLVPLTLLLLLLVVCRPSPNAGVVLTIEPGLYIPDDPAFGLFRGIGVRIEDDVAITGGLSCLATYVQDVWCVSACWAVQLLGIGVRIEDEVAITGGLSCLRPPS